jgi:hypothetical protein
MILKMPTLSAKLPWLAIAASLLQLSGTTHAAGLVSGRYQFQVPYSPVCLDGVYPLVVGEMATGCKLSVQTDASGRLTGTLDLRTLKGPAIGSVTLQNNVLSLQMQTSGQDASQTPSQIQAQLQANLFVGTATTSKGTVPCSMDVSAVAPLTVTFDLSVAINSQGEMTGTGTASSCNVQVPVNVSGSNGPDKITLRTTGIDLPDFVWEGSGTPTYAGFTAAYTAKGFGVSKTGDGVVIAPKAVAPALLGNISTRLNSQTGDNVLIGGFIITGTQPKKVIIRAIGPSLTLPGKMADPRLELHDGTGAAIASNDNWKEAANKQAIIDSTIPPSNDKESAIVASLSPGAYTAIVSGVNNSTGIALVEVYDLDGTVDSKLANISTRGLVQTGDNVLIGGFIVLGSEPQRVIIRAIGPSLPIANKLIDPTLELHDPNGGLLEANDDWISDHGAEVMATKVVPASEKESAIVATLLPGPYTAIVRGVNGATGVAVVEAYGLNP